MTSVMINIDLSSIRINFLSLFTPAEDLEDIITLDSRGSQHESSAWIMVF